MPEIFSASKQKKVDVSMQERYPLASFLMHPNGVTFETRESEEKIILFLRRHLITNVPWIITTIIMLLAPIFITNTTVLDSVPSNFVFIFVLIWYLITTAYFLESFLTWFFNVYIVTDERIIDIDFYNLIYKEVSDANIDKIQDVTYKMGGVVRTLFNYGDVLIQTASEVPNFDFLAVPYPDKVVKVLQDLRIEEQQEALEGRIR
ncbi:MAG: PH domain-containing protein [Candidatus Woesebacteria bacterium]|nr:PH domain-containing protein [Candidatus Woesebacteria bacterium]